MPISMGEPFSTSEATFSPMARAILGGGYSSAFDGMPGRALKTPLAEKIAQGDSFSLLKAIPNALEIKKILKQNWGQFLGTAWKMMAGEGDP